MEKFSVESEKGQVYTIQVYETDAGTNYQLTTSDNAIWTTDYQHRVLLNIVDNGNGFKVKPKLKKSIDYDQFAEFLIVSTFIKNYDTQLMSTYTIVESSDLIKL